jgi:membrane fusion protein (multidrug efflux system)
MVGGVLGGRWWVYAASHETTDNAQLAGHLYPISSRIPGTVAQVAVDENQRVTQGELLVQLDRHDYEVAV